MANIFDVAHYILTRKPDVSTMKLQKLCYYAQSWSLAWDGVPIFGEDFQAWANGPVSIELFSKHRGKYKIDAKNLEKYTSDEGLTDLELETIDVILEDYGDKSPHWLSELTHKERPWKETRGNLPLGERSNEVISKDLMQDYYTGLLSDE